MILEAGVLKSGLKFVIDPSDLTKALLVGLNLPTCKIGIISLICGYLKLLCEDIIR